MKRLQVKINNIWEYVFCRNEKFPAQPITCKDKQKAVRGDNHSMQYFTNKFMNCEFRIAK